MYADAALVAAAAAAARERRSVISTFDQVKSPRSARDDASGSVEASASAAAAVAAVHFSFARICFRG